MASNWDTFIFGRRPQPVSAPAEIFIPELPGNKKPLMEDSSEEIDLNYIIQERPKTKIIREFFRAHIENIKCDEEKMFEEL